MRKRTRAKIATLRLWKPLRSSPDAAPQSSRTSARALRDQLDGHLKKRSNWSPSSPATPGVESWKTGLGCSVSRIIDRPAVARSSVPRGSNSSENCPSAYVHRSVPTDVTPCARPSPIKSMTSLFDIPTRRARTPAQVTRVSRSGAGWHAGVHAVRPIVAIIAHSRRSQASVVAKLR